MELTVAHENASGEVIASFTLSELDEVMTVRELIQAFVYQKVADSNQVKPTVSLTEYEKRLNEQSAGKHTRDWHLEAEKAFDAFEKNAIFVIVDREQLKDLDQNVKIAPDSDVKFVRLIPLAGG